METNIHVLTETMLKNAWRMTRKYLPLEYEEKELEVKTEILIQQGDQ